MSHIHDKIDFTVETFLVRENKVLLRMHDKYKIWLGAGGHIELDENPVQAAIREVKEEVGIDVAIPAPDYGLEELSDIEVLSTPKFLDIHKVKEGHQHISLIYFAKSPTYEVRPAEGEAKTEFRWFTKEELDDPEYKIRETIRHYAKAAIEELGDR